mmetsp:Transcript_9466/g.21396  ORF Transcript_9466/g.21396 Transcript_9466/m.21396 type:complete len:114 (+) Transcript_9466:525-866(+)
MSGVRQIFALYRKICRAHRTLPAPMKGLGDAYAREEFRTHLRSEKVTDKQWQEFVSGWSKYLRSIQGEGDDLESGDLDEEILQSLSPEQQQQLERLKGEALKLTLKETETFNQ